LVILSRGGKKIGINFSGKGFTKAYDDMAAENTRLGSVN
jgi:invasion protein IalB